MKIIKLFNLLGGLGNLNEKKEKFKHHNQLDLESSAKKLELNEVSNLVSSLKNESKIRSKRQKRKSRSEEKKRKSSLSKKITKLQNTKSSKSFNNNMIETTVIPLTYDQILPISKSLNQLNERNLVEYNLDKVTISADAYASIQFKKSSQEIELSISSIINKCEHDFHDVSIELSVSYNDKIFKAFYAQNRLERIVARSEDELNELFKIQVPKNILMELIEIDIYIVGRLNMNQAPLALAKYHINGIDIPTVL